MVALTIQFNDSFIWTSCSRFNSTSGKPINSSVTVHATSRKELQNKRWTNVEETHLEHVVKVLIATWLCSSASSRHLKASNKQLVGERQRRAVIRGNATPASRNGCKLTLYGGRSWVPGAESIGRRQRRIPAADDGRIDQKDVEWLWFDGWGPISLEFFFLGPFPWYIITGRPLARSLL